MQVNDPNLTYSIPTHGDIFFYKQQLINQISTLIICKNNKDLSFLLLKTQLKTLYQPTYPQNDVCG